MSCCRSRRLYGSHPAAWARSYRSYRSCRSRIYLLWNYRWIYQVGIDHLSNVLTPAAPTLKLVPGTFKSKPPSVTALNWRLLTSWSEAWDERGLQNTFQPSQGSLGVSVRQGKPGNNAFTELPQGKKTDNNTRQHKKQKAQDKLDKKRQTKTKKTNEIRDEKKKDNKKRDKAERS